MDVYDPSTAGVGVNVAGWQSIQEEEARSSNRSIISVWSEGITESLVTVDGFIVSLAPAIPSKDS